MRFSGILRSFLLSAVLALAVQSAAQAALVVGTGVTFGVLETGGSFALPSVQGTALVAQTPSGDLAALTDFAAPSAPNSALFGVTFDISQAVLVGFDVNNFAFDNGDVVVLGFGAPQTAVTNAALTELLGFSAYRFTFSQSVDLGGTNLLVYGLTSITPLDSGVPEPGTFAGGAVALCVTLFVRRRRSLATKA